MGVNYEHFSSSDRVTVTGCWVGIVNVERVAMVENEIKISAFMCGVDLDGDERRSAIPHGFIRPSADVGPYAKHFLIIDIPPQRLA